MELDPAISQALDAVLASHSDQSDLFGRRFRKLVELVLAGNLQDSDVRRAMELLIVRQEADE